MKIGENSCASHILCNLCCAQAQGTIIDIYIENFIFISVIVFYFVFSAVFIGEGQNLTISFAFWHYIC